MAVKSRTGAQRKVTIKEVARQAGVSPMTVSNVINGKFARVGEETREKVQSAIAKLGYRLGSAGRSLRLSRQFLIEMVIVDPSPTFVADPFTTSILAGLSNCLNRRDYGLTIRGTTYERLMQGDALGSRQTDGVCVIASGPRKQRNRIYRHLADQHDPVVIFQDEVPADVADALSLMQDDAGGGALLAQHLLERGCRRFAWVTEVSRWPAFERREAAVRKTLQSSRSRASLEAVTAQADGFEAVQAAIAQYVRAGGAPDAFLCGNDQIGIAVLDWLADNSYDIPRKVRVTGFNAFDFWRYSRLPLTTIESPAYALGETGGNLLIERLQAGKFPMREKILPVSLRLGGST